MSKQYFIVELTDLPDADETRIEVEGGTNYAVGVLEDGVIKLVDYSYRSPDEARQAWPQLGVIVVEGMSQSETISLTLPGKTQKG
jgi:hypothetical protein